MTASAPIARAQHRAFLTLPNFVLPGDVSASKRYWARDIIVLPNANA
jgi:O-succinylbenzoate synthase